MIENTVRTAVVYRRGWILTLKRQPQGTGGVERPENAVSAKEEHFRSGVVGSCISLTYRGSRNSDTATTL